MIQCDRQFELIHRNVNNCRECHITIPLLSAIRIEKWSAFLLHETITSSKNLWPAQLKCGQLSVWVTERKQFSLISCLCKQTLVHSEYSLLYRPYTAVCCCKGQCVCEAIFTGHFSFLFFSSPSAGHEVYEVVLQYFFVYFVFS